jgi:carboxyl-terminal processing protease
VAFEEAKKLLKGPEKSLVSLGVHCAHRSSSQPWVDLVLERTQFDLEETKIAFNWKSPKTETAKKVAVISIPTFYGRGGLESGVEEKSVSEDFKNRLDQELLKETSHAGLVIDLRGNPGGYLEEAVSLGALFVGNRPIVGVLEDGRTRVLKDTTVVQPLYHRPLVVLVDEDSASAAEVLTGALKDYQRAVVVGSSRTYGKGTVQKLFPLEDPLLFSPLNGESLGTGVVKLTTSVFYSPLGHTPANGGIKTDIVVKERSNSNESLSKAAQDILPIVDKELERELESGLTQHQQNIELLKVKSRERLDSEPSLVEDKDLEEAIAIVSDLAQLNTF